MTNEPNTNLASRITTALSEQYEVTLELGRGGMAVVYLARDLRHERFVALKVFRPDIASAVGSDRFLLEIKTAAALEHPHILTLIDSGIADGLLYYVMPYIEGESLRQKIGREKQLGLEDTIRLTGHVASALDYAHRRGVIHRDIKPENILLLEESALVADFGIALAVGVAGSGRLTETGFALGTPQYMSPEQAAGDRELDARSDIYALGCLVYEMLTGEPPHTGATPQAVFSKTMTEVPTPISVIRSNVPEFMEAAVARALAKVPADRFSTPLGFVEALTDPDRPVTGPRSFSRTSFSATPHVGKRRRALGILSVGLAAVVIAVAWYTNWARSPTISSLSPTTLQVTFSGDARAVSLAPDAEMFAYLTDGGRAMMLRDIGGDVELRLAESTEPLGPPTWSLDGSTLLFAGNPGGGRGLYKISRLGGDASLVVAGLIEGPGQFDAARPYDFLTTDSSYAIAFSGARIYLGSEPEGVTRVTRDSFSAASGSLIDLGEYVARVRTIDVSPDGVWVVFVGTTSDQQVLLGTVAVDGSSVNVLAQADGISWSASETFGSPQWTASGDALFYSQHSGSGTNILGAILAPRTGTQRGEPLLVAPSLPAEITFGTAPTQRRLVYAGGANRTQLVLVTSGVAGSERLTTGTWAYHSPAVAPDGALVAYAKGNGDDEDIYVLSLLDQSERRLTRDRQAVGAMSWSPDGTRIVYSLGTRAGAVPRVVNVETGLAADVGAGFTNPGQPPQWAADGESLLLSRVGEGLVAVNLSTREESRVEMIQLRELFNRSRGVPTGRPGSAPESLPPNPERPLPDSATPLPGRLSRAGGMAPRVRMPVMAPDGNRFAAFLGMRAETGLWLLSTDEDVTRQLVTGLAWPVLWTNDDAVLFVRDPFGNLDNTRIEKVPSSGGTAEVVMELPFHCDLGNLAIFRDGTRVVCAVRENTSDVFVIDGLDMRMR